MSSGIGRRALITGGAGFIGSHLVDRLLTGGWAVDVLDDLSSGRRSNLAHVMEHPRLRATWGSILDVRRVAGLVQTADVVFHLAAVVGVRLVLQYPLRTLRTNTAGTEAVVRLAAKWRKPLLLASSSEVYGRGGILAREGDDLHIGPPSEPRWCYAASKLADEHFALAYAAAKDLPVVIARLFNTIGPRQRARFGMVVPRMVRQALIGRPITVYGDGRQRRSFTWVGDTVDAMIDLMAAPDAVGEIVNIGHTSDISILELARLIKDLTGSTSEIVFVSARDANRPDEITRRVPDISKLQQLTGYRPTRELPEMLLEIIRDHERSLAARSIRSGASFTRGERQALTSPAHPAPAASPVPAR